MIVLHVFGHFATFDILKHIEQKLLYMSFVSDSHSGLDSNISKGLHIVLFFMEGVAKHLSQRRGTFLAGIKLIFNFCTSKGL